MYNYEKNFEIPEKEKRPWQEIYNDVIHALYDPKVDGPKMSGSSGGPIGNDGVWVICESLHDPEALYLYVSISGKKLHIQAMNITDEKLAKITEVCKDFREVTDSER